MWGTSQIVTTSSCFAGDEITRNYHELPQAAGEREPGRAERLAKTAAIGPFSRRQIEGCIPFLGRVLKQRRRGSGHTHILVVEDLHRRGNPWRASYPAIHGPGLAERPQGRDRGAPCEHEPAVS
jgi:hypothetical protein